MSRGDEMMREVRSITARVQGPAVLVNGRPSLIQRILGVICPLCGKHEPWPYFANGAGACMKCRGAAVSAVYDEIDKFYKHEAKP
jgi:hypothetical protein